MVRRALAWGGVLGLLIVLMVAGLAEAQGDIEARAQALYKKLYCPLCGGIRLDVCELAICEDMREEILQRLQAGDTEEQIIEDYVERYGERVLAMPRPRGFNLLAWVVPGLGLVGGFVLVVGLIRTWKRRGAAYGAQAPPEVDEEALREVEEALRREL